MNCKKFISCLCACCIAAGASAVFPYLAPSVASSAESASNTINFNEIGQYTTVNISGTTEIPTWYSDNTDVAAVDSSGKITAVGSGTANVYAVFTSQVLQFNVIVALPESTTEQTVFDAGTVTLTNEGYAAQLTLSGVDTSNAVWSSSDISVATVDSKGYVTAVGSGTCVITAKSNGKSYNITINSTYVPQTPVTEVDAGTLSLSSEKPAALITISVPSGTEIAWSSDNESVAVVDGSGKVTAVGSGTCRITALVNGVKYITTVVSTFSGAVDEKIIGDVNLTNENPQAKITLTVPSGTQINWSSSDETVAKVDQEGNITAVGKGECTVTAEVNGFKYIARVHSEYDSSNLPEISATATTIRGIGNTVSLKVENNSNTPQWISTNVNVATVDENGTVTAVGVGTADIIANLGNAVCRITITVEADVVYGDADDDGDVDMDDVVAALCAASGMAELTAQGAVNADVYQNGDGISVNDAGSIQKYLALSIDSLPESYLS